jgi:hypothetical protein
MNLIFCKWKMIILHRKSMNPRLSSADRLA